MPGGKAIPGRRRCTNFNTITTFHDQLALGRAGKRVEAITRKSFINGWELIALDFDPFILQSGRGRMPS